MSLFFGPPNAELIGTTDDGTPVTANEDGVGRMIDISAHVSNLRIVLDKEDDK